MKSTKIAIFLLFLLSLASASAQTLTLDSCMRAALTHSHRIQSAQNDIESARQVRKQVLTKFFPQVNVTACGFAATKPLIEIDVHDVSKSSDIQSFINSLYDLAIEVDPTISSEIDMFENGYSFSASLVQPIYFGGRIRNGYKLAGLGVSAAESKIRMEERDLCQSVEEMYWLICGLREKRHTVQQVNALLDTLTEVVQTSMDAGLVTRNDMLKVELKKNEMAAMKLQLENGLLLATHALCQLIGIDQQDSLLLQPFPEEEEISLVAVDTFRVEGRPEAELLDMAVQAEQLRKRIAIGESLPMVAVGAVDFPRWIIDKSSLAVGFFLVRIPISGWWSTAHKIKEHNAKIQNQQLQHDELMQQMMLQNEQAYYKMTESATLLQQCKASVNLAEENYRMSMMNYEAGQSTISELLESQATLLQTQNQYTDERIKYRTLSRRFHEINK